MSTIELQKIEIHPFQTTSTHETCLLEIAGRFFEIGKDTAELLVYFKNNGCEDENIEAYVKMTGKHSFREIKDFLEGLAKKLSEEENHDKRKTFLYNKELLSPVVVSYCSSLLKVLFNKWVMMSVISGFVILDVCFFIDFVSFGINRLMLNMYLLIVLLCFFVFSSFFHELGHAAACRYWNISHGGIGLGLYINIPVFYTDVSNAWKLSRGKRLIVNLGGVYFQMILLVPLLITYLLAPSNILNYIILTMNFNFLMTLNPFFKFDGYWIMTDALGVANLRKRGKEWMQYMIDKLRRRQTDNRPYLLSLSKGAKIVLIGYTLVVNLFFGFYFFYMIPVFFIRFYNTFPDRMMQLLSELSYRQVPDWGNIQQIVLQLCFLGLFCYMMYRMIMSWFKTNTYKHK